MEQKQTRKYVWALSPEQKAELTKQRIANMHRGIAEKRANERKGDKQ